MPGSGSPAATLVGRFLVAAPSMPDERFQKSVVFICKHDDDGALGIIVNNKVEDLPLGQVYKQLGIEVSPAAAERAVLFGGPVETARGLVLHSADYKREETLLIEGGMALTASVEILKDMAGGSGPKQAWLALGHSGWAPGQLDREMQDNAWLVVAGDAGLCSTPTFRPSGSVLSTAWAARAVPAGVSTRRPFRTSPAAPDTSNSTFLCPLSRRESLMCECNSRALHSLHPTGARCAFCDP